MFFGRDTDTDELLSRLGRAPALAVLGNSGCGKSSLIRAGLIPALRRGRFRSAGVNVNLWRVTVFRPARAPFAELAKSLVRDLGAELSIRQRGEFIEYCREKLPLGGDAVRNAVDITLPPRNAHVLLIADQFEEIFTLCENTDERQRYISALLKAAQSESDVPVHLVLSMRADFYSRCLDHQELARRLELNLYNVPRMTQAQLRDAIEQRLSLAAAGAEEGLVDALLAEVGEEPGDLALLEHALGQLWERRGPNNVLTNGGYIDIGRLRGALGRHASEVYGEIGSEVEKHLVQRIFLELVQLGERAQDTRRRVNKEELLGLGPPAQIEHLLAHLASSRLIRTGGEGGENFVEVSHETLIREWPRLRQWLSENREDVRLERRLVQAAGEWLTLSRDPGALLQGARLAQANEWLQRHPGGPELTREYVETSMNAQVEAVQKEHEAQQREITHQQELAAESAMRAEAERKRAEEQLRQAKRLRRLVSVLAVTLLLALVAIVFASWQRAVATAREVIAISRVVQDTDPELSILIAAQGVKTTWPWAHRVLPEVEQQLHNAILASGVRLRLDHNSSVLKVAWSPDGKRLATAVDDGTAKVWDAESDSELLTIRDKSPFSGSGVESRREAVGDRE